MSSAPRLSCRCLSLFATLALFVSAGNAQYFGTNGSTLVPVAGQGHDYLHLLDETVDPASGSVNMNIAVPIAPGRQLTLPFNLSYQSNGVVVPTYQQSSTGSTAGLYPSWYQVVLNGDYSATGGVVWVSGDRETFGAGGWSYTFPGANQAISVTYANYGIPENPPEGPALCHVYEGYTFFDPNGGRHGLGMQSNVEGNPNCEDHPPYLWGGGHQYLSTTYGGEVNSGDLRVADLNGTLYTFGGGTCLLPSKVEDRNGNIINIQGPQQGKCSGPVTETDTLGRVVLSTSGFGTPSDTITVAGLGGTYTVTWGTASYNYDPQSSVTQTDSCSVMPQVSGSAAVITSITLPNKQQYQFSYDPTYGLLKKITYPTGAWVSYDWGMNSASAFAGFPGTTGGSQYSCSYTYGKPAIQHRYVSFDGSTTALKQDFIYSTQSNGTYWTSKTTQVITHDLNRGGQFLTSYTYSPGQSDDATNPDSSLPVTTYDVQVPVEQTVVYGDYTGSTLKTLNKTWIDVAYLASVATVLPDGSSATTNYSYADDSTYEEGYQLHEIDEYDYGQGTSGTPLRKTIRNYQPFGASPLMPNAPTIYAKPCQILISGSGGNSSETDYFYDGGTTVCTQTGGQQTAGVPATLPSDTHDESNYGPQSTAPRGNLTSVVHKCSPGCQDMGESEGYDETGQVVARADGKGNLTLFSYADCFANGPCQQPPGTSTNAFLTKITRPTTSGISHVSNYQYDATTGELTGVWDENGFPTSYQYKDPWNRPTEVDYADGGQTKTTYSDSGPQPKVTTTRKIDSTASQATVVVMDAMGHPTQTQLSAPEGTLVQDFTYDGPGMRMTASNPYNLSGSTATSSSVGIVQYLYDALGRLQTTTNPDNTISTTQYLSATTVTTDEAGNSHTMVLDAGGRLTSVTEPGSLQTLYTYDALSNLKTVNQLGTGTATSLARSFGYDSLSHLVTATNPETGSVCYGTTGQSTCSGGYDANGNLGTKTDANGTLITYNYDALDRLITETAPDGFTNISMTYDQGPNGIGRLTKETNNSNLAGTQFGYDPLGRVSSTQVFSYLQQQWVPGMNVLYDLSGNVHQLTYPDQRVVQQQWDNAGRLSTVSDITSSSAVVAYVQGPQGNGIAYWPSGAMMTAVYGNGVTEGVQLNNRLQPCHETANSPALPSLPSSVSNVLDRQLFYNSAANSPCGNEGSNNGNIMTISDNLNPGQTQAFSYDSLNRLQSAQRSDGAYSFSYNFDPFGNMIATDNIHGNLNYSIDPATNRLLLNQTDLGYDNAGNLTYTPNPLGGSHQFTYTALNQLRSIDNYQLGSYLYNGSGERSFANHGSSPVDYFYLNGQVMAELDSTGAWTDYIYADGRKIARNKVSDAPASSDVPVHLSGTVCSNCGGSATYIELDSGAGRIIQSGDALTLSQYAAGGSEGGVILNFADGSRVDGTAFDQDGQQINCDGVKNRWHQRRVDLSAYAGKTLASTYLIDDVCSAGGQFDMYFTDVMVSGNGTTSTIYSSQPGETFSPVDSSFWPGQASNTAAVAEANTLQPSSASGVNYYLADHLGTTQVELSSAGQVLWNGEFTPFGTEIDNGTTTNRYKFTGKERDTESGLDYFGARYYGSNMGRFMSPDDGTDQHPDNPQSWNLYTYGRNNPLVFTDPTGHSTQTAANGDVLAVYNDNDLGVYRHGDIDNRKDWDGSKLDDTDPQTSKMGQTERWGEFATGIARIQTA